MKFAVIIAATAILWVSCQPVRPLVLHVASDGTNEGPGTPERPLSLTTAIARIRQLQQEKAWPEKGVIVSLRKGRYFLETPLQLDASDAGQAGAPLVFKSNMPGRAVLSGGRTITGWRPLAAYKDLIRPWQFAKMVEVRRDHPAAICGFGIQPGDLKPWPDLAQGEVLWLNSWDASWHSIRRLDTLNHEIHFNSPANWTAGFYPGLPRYRVENVRQALDQPGEWYLNKSSGELFYLAAPGEDPNDMDIIAPVLEKLLLIKGHPGRPAAHLRFEGIRFSHTAYPMGIYAHTVHQEDIKPPYTSLFWDWPAHARRLYPDWPSDFLPGYTEPQAAVHAGQAVELRFAEHVVFSNCTFSRLGAHAVKLDKGARYCIIENSSFEDMGGGGIYIGMPISDYRIAGLKEEETPAFNRIVNNRIRHGGKVHPGAVGLWLAQAHDNQILHNEIAHFGYSGVNIGWTWGSKESYAKDNTFARNEIHHVMEVLADGGAFYSLGILPGNVYRENYIHHVSRKSESLTTITASNPERRHFPVKSQKKPALNKSKYIHMMRTLSLLFLSIYAFLFCSSPLPGQVSLQPGDERIDYTGRVYHQGEDKAYIGWPGVQISLTFDADTLYARFGDLRPDSLRGRPTANYYNVLLDDSLHAIIYLDRPDTVFTFSGWAPGPHRITFFRRTEGLFGTDVFSGFRLPPTGRILSPATPGPWIEFIGNSITAGYGNEGENQNCRFSAETENHYLSYAALTARELGYRHAAICWSGRGILRNYDGTKEGTLSDLWELSLPLDTAGQWRFPGPRPEAVVVNLGTNDFAKGIPDSTAFVNRYAAFLQKIRRRYPEANIFCLNGPMLQGNNREKLGGFLQAAVRQFGQANAYVCLLSPQTGELGYGCDWHPSLRQHQKTAKELTRFIRNRQTGK